MAERILHLILLAGGRGSRAAGDPVPKQFRMTGRGPLFAVSLKAFLAAEAWRPATVTGTAPDDWRPTVEETLTVGADSYALVQFHFHAPSEHTIDGVHTWDVDGKEMLVWGNYCNVMGGAVPVNIFYSTDNGQTVKIAYAFGQNPYYRDNGARGGSTGTLLGDPDNPVIKTVKPCLFGGG